MIPDWIRWVFAGTLRRQLILGVAIVHAVMMTLFIYDLTQRQEEMLWERQKEQATALSRSLAVSSASWLAANDVVGLQELIESQRRYPELVFAMLTNAEGKVLAHTDQGKVGLYVTDLPTEVGVTLMSSSPKLVDISAPAILAKRQVGWARVGIGQKNAARKMAGIVKAGVLYAAVAIVIGSILAWAMGRRITRRLYSIQDTLKKVKSGRQECRTHLEGTDEAAFLAGELNLLLDTLVRREEALRTSEEHLRHTNENLEAMIQDRTQRLSTSLELVERSEIELKMAQRVAHIGSWSLDLTENALVWSDETYHIFGIEPGTVMTLETFFARVHPQDHDAVALAWSRALSGEKYNLEHRILVGDRVKWVCERAELKFDEQGQLLSGIGTVQDISERKRAEEELAGQREEQNIILESMRNWVYYKDKENRFVRVNRAFAEAMGLPREQIEGTSLWELFSKEQADAFWKDDLEVIRSGCPKSGIIKRMDFRKGRYWVITDKVPYRNFEGEIIGVIGITFDITELKEAEEKMIHLASIVEFSSDAIISETIEGTVTSWNHGAENMFGYSAGEMLGKLISNLVPTEQNQMGEELLAGVVRGESVSQFECQRIRKDGQVIDVSLTLSPIVDREGNVIAVSKIARDITAWKGTEAELIHAKEAADLANRAKSEFLSNMSHEIRTPLNGIIGLSHLIMDTSLTPKQELYMRKIHTSSKALLGILNDILDYSKIEAGRLRFEEHMFGLDHLLSNVIDLFSIQAEEKGLEVLFEVAPNVPEYFHGDSLRLGQVLNNLVGNAVKFTRRGEIHIKIEALEIDEDHSVLSMSVRDTGIGISRQTREKLFRPFTQADGSTTRTFGGTGLGLAISKQIVELLGGKIDVESEPGRGSTFRFTVPLKPARNYPATRDTEHLKGMRVLVADDHPLSRHILNQILGSWSFDVTTVGSGMEARQKIIEAAEEGKSFELLLLDWKMPDGDGLDVAHWVEEEAEKGFFSRPSIIMMVTAFGREHLMTEAGPIHLDAVLTKPVTSSALFDSIIKLGNPDGDGRPTAPKEDVESFPETIRSVQGARVLLVEDNPINQFVAKGFLEKMGLCVFVADGGGQAVSMVEAEEFDAVFMDLQMPGMDGFEATARIRALDKGRELPIIAMTAAAMVQDKEACLKAGMNDHVPKPIDPDTLIETLLRWIRPGTRECGPPTGEIYPVPLGPGCSFELSGFDLKEAVARMAFDWAALKRALKIFWEENEGVQERLDDLIEKADFQGASRMVHSIRGASGNLGAKALFAASQALENDLKSGHVASRSRFAEQLALALGSIRDFLDSAASDDSAAQYDQNRVMRQLRILMANLEDHTVIPGNLIRDLCCQLKETQVERLGEQLERDVDHFDYSNAKETVKSIAEAIGFSLEEPK